MLNEVQQIASPLYRRTIYCCWGGVSRLNHGKSSNQALADQEQWVRGTLYGYSKSDVAHERRNGQRGALGAGCARDKRVRSSQSVRQVLSTDPMHQAAYVVRHFL